VDNLIQVATSHHPSSQSPTVPRLYRTGGGVSMKLKCYTVVIIRRNGKIYFDFNELLRSEMGRTPKK
jgi:hypothetical protein